MDLDSFHHFEMQNPIKELNSTCESSNQRQWRGVLLQAGGCEVPIPGFGCGVDSFSKCF